MRPEERDDEAGRGVVLSGDEREALVEYAEDAMTFGVGASTEALVGVRTDGPTDWAREFVAARNPVEVEAVLTARVAEAHAERDHLASTLGGLRRVHAETVRRLAEQQAAVQALADEWEARADELVGEKAYIASEHVRRCADGVRAALSDTTALDRLLAERCARAYDDGYNDATTMARCYGHTDHWLDEDEPRNPYRADALAADTTTGGEES